MTHFSESENDFFESITDFQKTCIFPQFLRRFSEKICIFLDSKTRFCDSKNQKIIKSQRQKLKFDSVFTDKNRCFWKKSGSLFIPKRDSIAKSQPQIKLYSAPFLQKQDCFFYQKMRNFYSNFSKKVLEVLLTSQNHQLGWTFFDGKN